MGISVNTQTNAHDNSIRQMNSNADNKLSISGALGGSNSQRGDLTTKGNLALTVPGLGLQNLNRLDTAADLYLRRKEIADNTKQYY